MKKNDNIILIWIIFKNEIKLNCAQYILIRPHTTEPNATFEIPSITQGYSNSTRRYAILGNGTYVPALVPLSQPKLSIIPYWFHSTHMQTTTFQFKRLSRSILKRTQSQPSTIPHPTRRPNVYTRQPTDFLTSQTLDPTKVFTKPCPSAVLHPGPVVRMPYPSNAFVEDSPSTTTSRRSYSRRIRRTQSLQVNSLWRRKERISKWKKPFSSLLGPEVFVKRRNSGRAST